MESIRVIDKTVCGLDDSGIKLNDSRCEKCNCRLSATNKNIYCRPCSTTLNSENRKSRYSIYY